MTHHILNFFKFFSSLSLGMIAFLSGLSVHAAGPQPTFSLEPTTPTTVTVPVSSTINVVYAVTNNTKVTRTLAMVPIAGVTQTTFYAGNCANPFVLGPNESCLLTLQLNGSKLPTSISGGPVICKTKSPSDNSPSPYLCSQPSASNILHATTAPAVLTTIQITPANSSLPIGITQQFAATALYSDDSKSDITTQASWSSSNPAIASISAQGLSMGVSAGTTTISASLNGVTGATNLTVTNATLSTIQVTPTNPYIANNTNIQFTSTGIFNDGTKKNITQQVSLSSSNPSVATTNSQAQATASAPGTTTITASLQNVSGTTNLGVTSASLTNLGITPAMASMNVGAKLQFNVSGVFSDMSVVDNMTNQVTWSSSNSNIASISSQGLVTAADDIDNVDGGATVMITATKNGITGTTMLTVNELVGELQIFTLAMCPNIQSCSGSDDSQIPIASGSGVQLVARAVYSDGSVDDLTNDVVWDSTDYSIASVYCASEQEDAGFVTGLQPGTATISASYSGDTVKVPVEVTSAFSSIAISPPLTFSLPLFLGTYQFRAYGTTPSGGEPEDITDQVMWASSNPLVAAVSNGEDGSEGRVTAVGLGSTMISAQFEGFAPVTTTLQIDNRTLTGVTSTPQNPTTTADIGNTNPIIATGMLSDGSNIDVTEQTTLGYLYNVAGTSIDYGARVLAVGATAATVVQLVSQFYSNVNGTPVTLPSAAIAPITLSTPIIGGAYQGGYVGCLDNPNGQASMLNLIVSSIDNSTGIAFANIAGGIGTVTSKVDGSTNTQNIINIIGSSSNYAAGLCNNYNSNGYGGWFLPSQEQLQCIYNNRTYIPSIPTNGFYWTSTQATSTNALGTTLKAPFVTDFANGYPSFEQGTSLNKVRCVRRISP